MLRSSLLIRRNGNSARWNSISENSLESTWKCSASDGMGRNMQKLCQSHSWTTSRTKAKMIGGHHRNYITIANATNNYTSICISRKWPYQNDFNLQNTRSYIFFEKGFQYHLNLFFSDSRQEARKLRRKQIVIKLKRNREKMMDALRLESNERRKNIVASMDMSSSSTSRQNFNQWKIMKQKRMKSFYSRRKSLAMQQLHNTKNVIKDMRVNLKVSSKEARVRTYNRFKSAMFHGEESALRTRAYNKFHKVYHKTEKRRERIQRRIRNLSQRKSLLSLPSHPLSRYSRYAITIDEPFRKEWFTKDGYPLTSRDPLTGRFLNPWNSESTNGFKRLVDVWRWKKTRFIGFGSNFIQKLSPASRRAVDLNSQSLSDSKSDFVGGRSIEELKQDAKEPVLDEIKLTWIGHATNLVHVSDKFTVLTDPMFSNKASPIQMFQESEFFGVPRWKPPSLSIDELGEIDVCVISHDHYDHLDLGSVEELFDKGIVKFWAVPLGLKDWLVDNVGIEEDRIVEMEWWQRVKFVKDSKNSGTIRKECGITNLVLEKGDQKFHSSSDCQDHDDVLVLTCAPAQHWCSRSPFDRNTRLWCSWAVHSKLASRNNETGSDTSNKDFNHNDSTATQLSFYFAGDTGYPNSFPLHRQIGDRLGPFDLAAIPIGAYKPRFFMHDAHCDPFEALKIHQDIRSKRSVAIHWGTFPLANEPFEEPPTLLQKAIFELERKSVDGYHRPNQSHFVAIPHGESIQSNQSQER